MPVTKLPSPQMGMNVEDLTNLMFRYYRELQYLLNGNLDSENVRSITTDQLIAGTAKIDTALIEDLTVGSNVTMGANATISWSQVTSQPSIPSTSDITQITANYVATPNLVTNIARVANSLSLGGGYKTYSSLSFDGIGSIDASDDVLSFSAMTGLNFDSYVSFNHWVDGLEDSGYAIESDIKQWVNNNFVAK